MIDLKRRLKFLATNMDGTFLDHLGAYDKAHVLG